MLLTTTGVAYIQYIIPLKGEQKAESKPGVVYTVCLSSPAALHGRRLKV